MWECTIYYIFDLKSNILGDSKGWYGFDINYVRITYDCDFLTWFFDHGKARYYRTCNLVEVWIFFKEIFRELDEKIVVLS